MPTLTIISFFVMSFAWTWSMLLTLIAQVICQTSTPTKRLSYMLELWLTTTLFSYLWFTSVNFIAYSFFFSALIITFYTDIYCMLISRFFSLYLVPTGILASYLGYLPISTIESILASFAGYGFFYSINAIFRFIKKQDGLGQGDMDLLAFIGSYTGFIGCWFTILYGSILGTVITIIYMIISKKQIKLIPFGSFLSIGAMLFVLSQDYIVPLIII